MVTWIELHFLALIFSFINSLLCGIDMESKNLCYISMRNT